MTEPLLRLKQDRHVRFYRSDPFKFATELADHPSVTMEAVRELALRPPPEEVFFSSGALDIDDDFDSAHRTRRTGLSLGETVANMEGAGSYPFIREPNFDPEWNDLFRTLLDEVRTFELRTFQESTDPGISEAMLYMFVDSPRSQIPLNVDPRLGAPHAVVSGPEVSVGLSITFRIPASGRLAAARCHDHGARLEGPSSRPGGDSTSVDVTEQAVLKLEGAARRALRR